ncbi:MAG: hypothetical protein CME64_15965 [Halobacteriovoraceae bacterium]|nr:hypothetical protein [Halobacteriovoraceae bacterium]|tara:strand:+ start:8325 stop:9482 length:1158 start_codon:yes stop_codon:yes gene_type:complete
MNLEKWLETNIGYEAFTPGLERISKAMDLFDLNLSQKRIISIAGTNGKGQTSRAIYKRLCEETNCALWTSPHLISLSERYSKNGRLVEGRVLEKVCLSAHQVLKDAKMEVSYFEFLFLVFLIWAKDCDVLVLEVGLGGRMDAVNAVDADISLITSISRDHQEYLGNRYELILKEKFGIARKDKTLITNFELSYLRRITAELSKDLGCNWVDLFEEKVCDKSMNFSERNLLLAKVCVEKVLKRPLEKDLVGSPLIEFELYGTQCHGLTSHNTDGVRKGVQFLKHDKYTSNYELVLMSFSDRRPEDAKAMLDSIIAWRGGRENIVLCAFKHPKAMRQDLVESLAKKARVKFVNDAVEFFKESPQEKALVLGSNYFIGQLLQCSSSRR